MTSIICLSFQWNDIKIHVDKDFVVIFYYNSVYVERYEGIFRILARRKYILV